MPYRRWTYDSIKEEALKYDTKKEFYTIAAAAYYKALKYGWLEELTSHMKTLGSKYKRLIYAFEFPDNHVYIGLTFNITKRTHSHLYKDKSSTVNKHIVTTGVNPTLTVLTDYVVIEEALRLEEHYINHYKNLGFQILNIAKSGSLGGTTRLTIEHCKDIVKTCKTKQELRKKYSGVYEAIYKNKWFEILEPLIIKNRGKIKYDKQKCLELIMSEPVFENKKDFERKFPSAFTAINRNKWGDLKKVLESKTIKKY